jgi:N-acetylneuraminic acid mutarotase
VTRYDILSDTYLSSEIKANSLGRFNPKDWNNGEGWTALSHPSNNSIFLINGPNIFLFDNQNELMLKKQSYSVNEHLKKQTVCYSEGFIYMLGGYCTKEKKQKRTCTRYNIVTEKWQKISNMIFARENAAACAINEFQIIVAGGRLADGNLTDIVEIYDLRENTWKVFSHGISSPR